MPQASSADEDLDRSAWGQGSFQAHGAEPAFLAQADRAPVWAGLPAQGGVMPAGGAALVRALQRELIPHMARAHRGRLAGITPLDVDMFTADAVRGDERAVAARLDVLRQQGFAAHTLCLELLAPAARHMGSMWDDDRCDFATVTLGVGLLQRMLRALGPGAWPKATGRCAGLQLLLAQAPQEQHSFGTSMAAQFFSSAGWSVSGGVGDVAVEAAARVQTSAFDVVGFSVGGEIHMDWLKRQIDGVRLASRNPGVLIMVGGPLFTLHPQWAVEVGADLCPASLHEAPAKVARMVRAQRQA